MQYAIIVETGENNYSAYAPDLPGCIATGDTLDDVLTQMKEAIEFHLESLRDYGDLLPLPTSLARTVDVDVAA